MHTVRQMTALSQRPKCLSKNDRNVAAKNNRIPSYVGLATYPECPTKDRRGKSCWLHQRENGPEVAQGPVGVTTSQGGSLGMEQPELFEVVVDREVFLVFLGSLPTRPARDEKLSRK